MEYDAKYIPTLTAPERPSGASGFKLRPDVKKYNQTRWQPPCGAWGWQLKKRPADFLFDDLNLITSARIFIEYHSR